MSKPDDGIHRLSLQLEECRFLPDGYVLVVFRSPTDAAMYELARMVGRECAAAVMFVPDPAPAPLPSKPEFHFTRSPRPWEPLGWSSVLAPFPGLAQTEQTTRLRHIISALVGQLA